jgi:hypothetical protein
LERWNDGILGFKDWGHGKSCFRFPIKVLTNGPGDDINPSFHHSIIPSFLVGIKKMVG